MTKTFAVLLVAVALAAAPAFARDPSFAPADPSHGAEILPSPPADGSDGQRAELAQLHEIEKTRTAAEVAQAQWDAENEHIFLFKTVFGDKFNEQNLPLTAAFGRRVANDESVNAGPAKAFFHRIHPYTYDTTLNPVCKSKGKDDSYPSGHTTLGFLLGLTLTEMAPEKRDEILARAESYGHNRLVCGVHYPSDVQAAKLLAYSVHAIMTQNPQYRQELAAARTEMRAVLGLPEMK
ncbi:MAG: acid phosphatase [Roseiarcus sp.]